MLNLLLTALAAALGASVALACGCGADGMAAAGAAGVALFGHGAVQWRRAARVSPGHGNSHSGPQRDRADILAMLVIGGGTLVAARSGPGLLLVGAVALGLGWAATREQVRDAPLWQALAAGASSWLTVLGVDQAHRHGFSTMGAILGGGLALLVASAHLLRPPARHLGSAALLGLVGHAWVLGWWAAGWLPTLAWWAMAAAPLSPLGVLAAASGRTRAGAWLAWLAAALQGGLLTTALWAVVALR